MSSPHSDYRTLPDSKGDVQNQTTPLPDTLVRQMKNMTLTSVLQGNDLPACRPSTRSTTAQDSPKKRGKKTPSCVLESSDLPEYRPSTRSKTTRDAPKKQSQKSSRFARTAPRNSSTKNMENPAISAPSAPSAPFSAVAPHMTSANYSVHPPTSAPPSDSAPTPRRSARLAQQQHKQPPKEERVAIRESNRFYTAKDHSSKNKLAMVPRPEPTYGYVLAASEQVRSCPKRQLLVILDLNGTLVYRNKNHRTKYAPRPQLDELLDYLFKNHKVMIWSSATRENVQAICKSIMSEAQFRQLVAVWDRDSLRLTSTQFKNNSQIYKQLSWVWTDPSIQDTAQDALWSQHNTILIDDSPEKVAGDPFNHMEIREFKNTEEDYDLQWVITGQIIQKLEELSTVANVSASLAADPIRNMPARNEQDGAQTAGEDRQEARDPKKRGRKETRGQAVQQVGSGLGEGGHNYPNNFDARAPAFRPSPPNNLPLRAGLRGFAAGAAPAQEQRLPRAPREGEDKNGRPFAVRDAYYGEFLGGYDRHG